MSKSENVSRYIVDFDPFLIKFPEGFFLEGIRWYGLSYLFGFLIGLFLLNLYYRKKKSPLNSDANASLIFYLLFGVIVGGRLGFVLFYDFENFCNNPLITFQIWKGGMASHGGFIGVAVSAFLFGLRYKVGFLFVADLIASIGCPGIFLGRIANFINGELWGKISNVAWAVIFPNSAPNMPISEIAARHPSQLYEAFLEGLFLFIYMQYRFWKCKLPKGQLAGEFCVIYAFLRIFCEIFREPDKGLNLILGLSRGTFYSLITLFIGVILIIIAKILKPKAS